MRSSRHGGLMLSAYLFDQRGGERIEAWQDALRGLTERQMLWLDLQDSSEKDESKVRAALDLNHEDSFARADASPSLDQREGYLRVDAVAVSDVGDRASTETVTLSCFI